MELFLKALALAIALEGACFALFPDLVRQAMLEAASRPDRDLRALGGAALAFAIGIAISLSLYYK